MKILSLWQPWVSFLGVYKMNETRSWGTLYKGPVAIHAAKRMDPDDEVFCLSDPWFKFAFDHAKTTYRLLPRGCIVGVGHLIETVPYSPLLERTISDQERAFGAYGPGRVAWRFSGVERLLMPITVSGRRGLMDLEPELTERVNAAEKQMLTPVSLVPPGLLLSP